MQHPKRISPLALAALLLALLLAGCQNGASPSSQSAASSGVATPIGGSTKRDAITSSQLQFQYPQSGDLLVIMETNKGIIRFVLYPDEAPLAVQNFTTLAQQGYYTNTQFHRVVQDFVIQGGDATGTGVSGKSIWGHPFATERSSKLHHYSGALCMAPGDNLPNTNQSQFFVVATPQNSVTEEAAQQMRDAGIGEEVVSTYLQAGGAPYLDNTCTVFGQVYEGMDIVDAIARVATEDSGRPKTPVVILSVNVDYYGGIAPQA